MAKKILYIMVFLILILTNNTFAEFEKIYMVNEEGSFTEQSIFELNEIPWLYTQLPEPGIYNIMVTWWLSPSGEQYYTHTLTDAQDFWISLNDGYDTNGNSVEWFDIMKVGDWTVNASYHYATGEVGSGSTNFTVTPEPVASLLFIVGGAVLTFKYYRKKRKKLSN
jgi:hypothetical protein